MVERHKLLMRQEKPNLDSKLYLDCPEGLLTLAVNSSTTTPNNNMVSNSSSENHTTTTATSTPSSSASVSGIKRRNSAKIVQDLDNFAVLIYDANDTTNTNHTNQVIKSKNEAKTFIRDNYGKCTMEKHLMQLLVLAGIILIKKKNDNDDFLSNYFNDNNLTPSQHRSKNVLVLTNSNLIKE